MFPVKSFSTDIYASVAQSFSALKTSSHIFLQDVAYLGVISKPVQVRKNTHFIESEDS